MAKSPRLAVLIDGDNISPRYAEGVFNKIAVLGAAKICRVYCDLAHKKSWTSALEKYHIHRRRIASPTPGKNASDIALVIDAMDLLHGQSFDGFCVVSSDSDFARLAIRLRKDKITVYGFGTKSAPTGFQEACCGFFDVDELMSPAIPMRA